MKTWKLIMVALLALAAAGCRTTLTSSSTTNGLGPDGKVTSTTVANTSYAASNMAQKSVAAGGAVTAVKVVTSLDPSSGSSLPELIIGFGTFFVFDLPAGVSAYFQDIQKSMFTSEVGSETTLLIMGTGSNATHVEIANPELIVNIPGIKIFSPVSDNASVTATSGRTTATAILPGASGKMPVMPPMPAPAPVNPPAAPMAPIPAK
jgi:hypothetical protein